MLADLQPVAHDVIIECLAAGSGIRMADGSERAIEQAVAGDMMLAFDASSETAVPARVSRAVIRRDARKLILINGSLAATTNHTFLTPQGHRRAEELRVGDMLLRLSQSDVVPAQHPEASAKDFAAFKERLYSGDFVFSVSREQARAITTPLLVLLGNDAAHPNETSRELASLVPNAELMERWKEPELVAQTIQHVRAFLKAHTPRD